MSGLPICKISLRLLRSDRYGALARFMSLSSTLGIMAGVGALILGLSAMNGFEYELQHRVLGVIPSGEIRSAGPYFTDAPELLSSLRRSEGIGGAAPALLLGGVLSKGSSFAPVSAIGIDPAQEGEVASLESFCSVPLSVLRSSAEDGTVPVIVGAGAARKLSLSQGDSAELIVSATAGAQDILTSPLSTQVSVAGILSTGGQTDQGLLFLQLENAQSLSGLPGPNVLQVRTVSALQGFAALYGAAAMLPQSGRVSSWYDTQGKLYNDIQMVRGIMYLAMILVMAVACFNIVANLIMSVSEKTREIAILKTMGAPRRSIVVIFTLMGLLQGLRGTVLGVILGVLLTSLVTPFTTFLRDRLDIELLNPDIYFIDFIPSRLSLSDVALVALCAVIMSLCASLYPALKASRVQPAAELGQ
ncbi:MAG: FtsX-like permease family protein [Succinivibrio sp.]|nr:FtsX-like permease family protein [Succinivibrio sp.]